MDALEELIAELKAMERSVRRRERYRVVVRRRPGPSPARPIEWEVFSPSGERIAGARARTDHDAERLASAAIGRHRNEERPPWASTSGS